MPTMALERQGSEEVGVLDCALARFAGENWVPMVEKTRRAGCTM